MWHGYVTNLICVHFNNGIGVEKFTNKKKENTEKINLSTLHNWGV